MGRHFDALVELTRQLKNDVGTERIPSARQYLESIVRRAALFEFPLCPNEILEQTGKSTKEYADYMADYFGLSARYGASLLLPFKVTSVEDAQSVLMLDYKGDNRYVFTEYFSLPGDADSAPLACSHVRLGKFDSASCALDVDVDFQFACRTGPKGPVLMRPVEGARTMFELQLFMRHAEIPAAHNDDNKSITACKNRHLAYESASEVPSGRRLLDVPVGYLGTAIEQLVYIMDPENFIIRKESNLSIQRREKDTRKGSAARAPLRKTVIRPHYICLSAEDTASFLQSESKVPRPAHPVRGHWRRLMSEKFTHKHGQTIFVRQYFTGEGKIEGRDGWHYEVMVKEDPTRLVPYSQADPAPA